MESSVVIDDVTARESRPFPALAARILLHKLAANICFSPWFRQFRVGPSHVRRDDRLA
jgi:hypothetical protein